MSLKRPRPPAEPSIYVRVDHTGKISRAPTCSSTERDEANFIAGRQHGKFVIWKDRYGDPGTVTTKARADARALDHADVAQGRKRAEDIYQFAKRRQRRGQGK